MIGWTARLSAFAHARVFAAALALLAGGSAPTGPARAADGGAVATGQVEITTREREGVGCIVGSSITGAATVVFSGAALAISVPGVAATAVAVPVLVATMAAGCSIGAVAAPGVAWLGRQKGRLAEIVDGVIHQLEGLMSQWAPPPPPDQPMVGGPAG